MKLLTWNIQAGIGTKRYRDYLFHAHRQVIHTAAKTAILREIAREITPYDVVCLQEVDLGGRRAGYRSQIELIAAASGHGFVAVQQNRVIPGVSRHGNAILSRWPLEIVEDLKLPGRVAGRGCLIVDVAGPQRLRVACLHLSLGAADQAAQLAVIAQGLMQAPRWVAMGDFNCGGASAPIAGFCALTDGRPAGTSPASWPSWRPRRDFDHIIASGDLAPLDYRADPLTLSDHRPISARI
jgi:endonuclease/exonuclease/phosphatase family metal-dependent hydrolase